jgi:hypothetical protein
LEEGMTANLADAEIQIGFQSERGAPRIKSNADGSFVFETSQAGILAFARTADGRAYGTIVSPKLDELVEIKLASAQDYEGQLLGKNDQPVAGEEIRATIKIDVPHFGGSPKPLTLEIPHSKAKTTSEGKFTLRGLPTKRDVTLYCTSMDRKHTVCLDRFQLKPDDLQARKVFRLESFPEPPKETPLAERFQSALGESSRTGRRAMLILAHDSEAVKAFIDENFLNSQKNKAAAAFTSIVVPFDWNRIKPTDIQFISKRDWMLPSFGMIDAYVFDADGKSIGRQTLSIMNEGQAEKAAEFLREYAPAPPKQSAKD